MEPPFPPFEPDDNDAQDELQQPTRLRDIPLRTLFPNILTLLAICSGLTAIRFAIEGRIEMSLAAIILAAFLDGIDGRVARFLKSSSRFGAQLDSLADFVNFGVAPAMVLYFTLLDELRPFGWIAGLIYAICACLRLARFNVQLDNPNRPSFHADFFVGVPAPAAAMVVLLPLYLMLLGVKETILIDVLATLYIIVIGLLMVSNLPTYSGKSLGQKIPSTYAMPLILVSVVLIAILLSYPWLTLATAAIAYLIMLPWGRSYYLKLEQSHLSAELEKSAQVKKTRTRTVRNQSPAKPAKTTRTASKPKSQKPKS